MRQIEHVRAPRGGSSVNLPPRVSIREVGPRDGLQIEAPVPTSGKLDLLRALAATGVPRIEATAFVSPRAVPALADAEQVAAALPGIPGPQWSALVASPSGAARAVAAGLRDLEHVVSASDGHSLANARRTSDEAVNQVGEVARAAHEAGGTCEVVVAVAWDCPFDGPVPVQRTAEVCARAVELGADALCLGDTIGTASPARVVAVLDAVRAAVGEQVPVGAHFHDTRGMGIANALAALQVGVTQLDASVGGTGGCPFAPGASGNIATEELVYLLEDAGVETGIDLAAVLHAARTAEDLLGKALPSGLLRAGGRSRPRARS
jgi:hydroxymethylglutaryl-CoA lyase